MEVIRLNNMEGVPITFTAVVVDCNESKRKEIGELYLGEEFVCTPVLEREGFVNESKGISESDFWEYANLILVKELKK